MHPASNLVWHSKGEKTQQMAAGAALRGQNAAGVSINDRGSARRRSSNGDGRKCFQASERTWQLPIPTVRSVGRAGAEF